MKRALFVIMGVMLIGGIATVGLTQKAVNEETPSQKVQKSIEILDKMEDWQQQGRELYQRETSHIGRYQIFMTSTSIDPIVLLDTATGQTWQRVVDPETKRHWFAKMTVEGIVSSHDVDRFIEKWIKENDGESK